MAPAIAVYYDRDQLRSNSFFLNALVSAGRSLGVRVAPIVGCEELGSARLDRFDAILVRSRSLRQRIWLERRVRHVVNNRLLALLGNDKLAQYLWCKKYGFATPEIFAFGNMQPPLWVAKPRFGHGGRGVRMIEGRRWRGNSEFLLAQAYSLGADRDHRHYVIGTTIAATVERRASGDFRSNVSLGASVRMATPDPIERRLVQAIVQRLGPGYYGVDIVASADGPMVMEIEDLVGARSLYRLGVTDHPLQILNWMCEFCSV